MVGFLFLILSFFQVYAAEGDDDLRGVRPLSAHVVRARSHSVGAAALPADDFSEGGWRQRAMSVPVGKAEDVYPYSGSSEDSRSLTASERAALADRLFDDFSERPRTTVITLDVGNLPAEGVVVHGMDDTRVRVEAIALMRLREKAEDLERRMTRGDNEATSLSRELAAVVARLGVVEAQQRRDEDQRLQDQRAERQRANEQRLEQIRQRREFQYRRDLVEPCLYLVPAVCLFCGWLAHLMLQAYGQTYSSRGCGGYS